MTKKIIITVILIFATITINSQNDNLLIGKWVFKDVYNKEKIDAVGLAIKL